MTTAVSRPPLVRGGDRVIAGVCAGLASHLGWPVRMVRIGMAVAALAGGAGVAFYAWLWIMVPTADESARRNARRPASPIAPAVSAPFAGPYPGPYPGGYQGPAAADFAGPRDLPSLSPDAVLAADSSVQTVPATDAAPQGPAGKAAAAPGPWPSRVRSMPYGKEILLGSGLLLAAGILIARMLGFDVPLGTLIPVAAILGGAAIAWMQLDETRRAGLVDKTKADQAGGWARLAAGLALVVAGVLVMVSGSGSWEQTWLALLASVAVLGGVGLVLLPWGLKFWRDLEAERSGRVRATERAEIAAHLHDSVLQTLALIQRRAGNEHDVVRLARAQERELRGWLYRDPAKEAGQLSEGITAAAAEVEDALGQAVEVVSVGDCAMTERHEALVQAAREAMVNAARHGGGAVSVYLEVTDGAAEVFVKDRGPGFDPDSVPADRLGVRESIIGRMNRHGGTAAIISSPDGTEVRLRLPLEARPSATNGAATTER
ncbi:signal transduction histidine kinase/phage shock protein PspC (stress-responsive transcriptional regulator) [Arthrobacter sp. V4I6]|uniref:ATP-binding protein n=1 Tax=unclassified Arthrobacter TaxID=235627 RepID=UPI002785C61C|nr:MULTISPECIES: ATP-binding protein [unclassified Arthrobacter]MDQ0819933.1 signal transduction histidine kinase/phage shock protein PspC (stress-responsive transcriptional regulator) [Arthrobacter sp. V1I7]MDQ0854115.1 signal transduction histidine kinase/phage shock protein PspC (stress-responsive transcriptional regulator) [Arthrobacter sp. V4I6]